MPFSRAGLQKIRLRMRRNRPNWERRSKKSAGRWGSAITFYVWRKKYRNLGPSELRRLRQLEEENRKLKQIVANLSLEKAMLLAVVAKKGGSLRTSAPWSPS